jgi:hypothetical protein
MTTTTTTTETATLSPITQTVLDAMRRGVSGSLLDVADKAGTKRTATQTALKRLVELNLVTLTPGSGVGATRVPDFYVLTIVETPKPKAAPKAESGSKRVTVAAKVLAYLIANPGAHTVQEIANGILLPKCNSRVGKNLKVLATTGTGVEQVGDPRPAKYAYAAS